MSRKYLGVLAVVALILSGCGQNTPDPQPKPAPPQATKQAEKEPESTLSETTLKRALKAEDFVSEVVDGRLKIDAATIHLELPADFAVQKSKIPGRIGYWANEGKSQAGILSVVGTSGVAPDPQQYAEYLNSSPSLEGMNVEYLDDVLFGQTNAHHFRINGASQLTEIFGFDLDGISYEYTVKADDQAGIDGLRELALATVINPSEQRNTNGAAVSDNLTSTQPLQYSQQPQVAQSDQVRNIPDSPADDTPDSTAVPAQPAPSEQSAGNEQGGENENQEH
ncbi:hypothetical protein [Arcanobacterium phocae]|uniref:hypothetical protein n=1 Tax=Arcanobacterium phocae TaxID=131112 RepID=UPI001C0EF691|nr:hypothetical protein [Arcanobacterium phocae]